MAYTVVELRMVDTPLVAIYKQLESQYEARTVVAIAIYRNPEDRGGENILVPLTASDFTSTQSHYALNRREVNTLLPAELVTDRDLCNAVADDGGTSEVTLRDFGWVVV